VTRDDALAYLQNEFSAQIADTGQPDTDTIDGFETVINSALRELGIARSAFDTAEVADEDEGAFQAFLDYFALLRFAKLLAQNINIGTGGDTFSLQQAFGNVKSLLEMAKTAAQVYGLGRGGASAYSLSTLNLGFLATDDGEY
jgi:hypothetical protein